MKRTSLSLMITACFIANAAAQETKSLSPVVVTATRVEQDSFDLPMSIDKVEKDTIQNGGVKMTLSESLARVPGITAQNRNQMAQDPQISSRGFGARSSFGVRGIRVYVDGIPLSMPDGIGNPGSVDLGAMSSIEVMRGPFSAMYGNSSGGVIQMFTDKAPATPEVSGDILFGSFNTRRESVQAAGTKNGVEYLVNLSNYNSDGYRQQSGNDKRQATAKLGIKIAEDTKLTMLTSWFDQFAQDPGGLTAANLAANPTLASPNNVTANARVIRSNIQTGFNLEKIIDTNNSLNFVAYGGERSNLQYLFSSVTAGFNGRASSINRDFYGFDGNWTNKGNLNSKPYTLTAGVNFGSMVDNRKDDRAINGNIISNNTSLNQKQVTQNFDQYIQGMWSAAERIDLHGGIRNTNLKMTITDRLGISSGGELEFNQTNPVAGVVVKASPTLNFYANAGRGFETPTMIEVTVNNAATGAGPNLNMKPSTSTNFEIGSKWLVSDDTKINTAIFDISTKNEIVIATSNSGTGYTSYTNAGKTKRTGLELSGETKILKSLTAYAAYTWLDAKFDEDFTTNGATVKAGNNIPGTYRSQIYTELNWKFQPLNYNLALESRYNSKVYVKDSASTTSDSYLIFSVRTSLTQNINNWKITEYARVDNIFDKTYVGSVRVNDSNSRFFEPAPGRNWIMGVKANYMF